MAIRLVPETHMPETEVREAMIQLDGSESPIQAHYHKCAEKGDIHVCIHDKHPAAPVVKTRDDDEDEEDDEGSEVEQAKPAPDAITRESLFLRPLRLVINDGRDSTYNGHFDGTGLFVPDVKG